MIPKRSGRGTGTAVVATIATLFALMLGTPAVASAGTTEETPTIVYSETYLSLMALVPSGWTSNACELSVVLSGVTGVCTTEFAPVFFYPDGSFGDRPWIVDPSSPTGWSPEPNPCDGVNWYDEQWWPLYIAWIDWYTGYTETPPALTDLEAGCLIQLYGF